MNGLSLNEFCLTIGNSTMPLSLRFVICVMIIFNIIMCHAWLLKLKSSLLYQIDKTTTLPNSNSIVDTLAIANLCAKVHWGGAYSYSGMRAALSQDRCKCVNVLQFAARIPIHLAVWSSSLHQLPCVSYMHKPQFAKHPCKKAIPKLIVSTIKRLPEGMMMMKALWQP